MYAPKFFRVSVLRRTKNIENGASPTEVKSEGPQAIGGRRSADRTHPRLRASDETCNGAPNLRRHQRDLQLLCIVKYASDGFRGR
ncbi:unnamed protein product [Lactuca virosa]|uniref:Uncharacterized protein n=1 Tax=Lactuca virosa TaxID=75947 RepID=A0AAU9MKY9_9ASTR|nr:unnamed protein product [Lactuca virosa]